jgi:hypothetical protein
VNPKTFFELNFYLVDLTYFKLTFPDRTHFLVYLLPPTDSSKPPSILLSVELRNLLISIELIHLLLSVELRNLLLSIEIA